MKNKTPLLQKKQPSKSQIKMPVQSQNQKAAQSKIALKAIAKENKIQMLSQRPTNKNTILSSNQNKPLAFTVIQHPKIQAKNTPKPTKFRPLAMQQAAQQLFPCRQCGRSFVQTSLKRHEQICKKIFINKRKEFNSAKQRIVSKQQINLAKKNKINEPKKQIKVIIPKWKQQSMAFRIAMKNAKGKAPTQEELNFLAKEKKIVSSTMFKCKFCSRTFNQEAGKRHEFHCQLKSKDMANKNKKK